MIISCANCSKKFNIDEKKVAPDLSWRQKSISERLAYSLVQGINKYIIEDNNSIAPNN